ncbi:MAG: hypothetical protein ACYCVZ_14055 [Streptosporangiaceae bacterium]
MRIRIAGGVLGAAMLASGLLAGPWMAVAQAAPAGPAPVIESVGCNDVTTLNSDIATADSTGTPTIIDLAAGCVYQLTTVETGVVGGIHGPVGLTPVTGTVTLIGHLTTIERSTAVGTPAFRIAEVFGLGASLTIEGITLRNGLAAGRPRISGESGDGGCLLADGSLITPSVTPSLPSAVLLVLRDSTLENCGAAQGGGIYLAGGTAGYLYKTDVLHSTAVTDGGGIYLEPGSTARIGVGYLARNSAGGNGGAIYSAGQSLTLTGSQLFQNSASSEGGGVYSDGTVTNLNGSTLEFNQAGTMGGGVSAEGGTTNVRFSLIEANDAGTSGGGIWQGGGTVWMLNSFLGRNLPNNCAPGGAVRGCYL